MNLVGGNVAADNGSLRFRAAGFDVALPPRFNDVSPGPATLGIRPEHVRVASNGGGTVTLPVRLVEPLGRDTLLYFEAVGDRPFVAVSEGLGMSEVPVGARLGLTLESSNLHLFDKTGRRLGRAA
jgi:multiple sugar transport system ATP-binding protein